MWSQDGQTYTTKYFCPVKPNKKAYVVNFRLNPLQAYKVDFPTSMIDEYAQKLATPFSATIKTGPINPIDRYLYSSIESWSQTQVIPSSLPLVIGTLSINTDSANILACEMNQDEYLSLLVSQRFTQNPQPSKCTKSVQKTIPIKNKYWALSPKKIDIENDVLESKFSTPFVYIK